MAIEDFLPEKLRVIKDAWARDQEIDMSNIDDELARLPKIHQKYLDFLSVLKIQVFEKNARFLKLKGARSRWYNGQCSKEELDSWGWDQYQGKVPLKSELERLLEVDDELLTAEKQLFELKACFEYAEEILNHIRYRGNDLRAIAEWKKFLAGN